MGQGKRPLCKSHYAGDGWQAYFPLHCRILMDIEAANDLQVAVSDEPVDQPTRAWCRRKVKKILGGPKLGKVEADAAHELRKSITDQRPFDRQGLGRDSFSFVCFRSVCST